MYASSFDEILKNNKCYLIPGIYDGLTALIAEKMGFVAAWVGGFSVTASMGIPDSNVQSVEDLLKRVREIRAVSKIHLIVDCDEGFGSIENTLTLIKGLVELKVSAICIEDNLFPKVNSFYSGNGVLQLEPVNKFSLKISEIKSRFPTLTVIARTEALIQGLSMEEAMYRSVNYVDAGADVILIHSKFKNASQFQKIRNLWGKRTPLLIVPTLAEGISFEDFSRIGFKFVVYANQLLRISIRAMEKCMEDFIEDLPVSEICKDAVSMEHVFSLTGLNSKKP